MVRTRELRPDDARALTALYEDYEWWADREVDDVRSALAETEVALGVEDERFDPETEIPGDGTDELVRMTYAHSV